MTPHITLFFAVALGGALGAVARYSVTLASQNIPWQPVFWRGFPIDTFAVNLVGSLLAGVCLVLMLERGPVPEVWRALVLVGFFGAFTTFSAFSLQTINLFEEGRLLLAAAYIVSSLVLSLASAGLGIFLARQVVDNF